ncbi:MAG: aspartate aminotransferase family protein [Alphaproteobacteria bacterium]|nr:aspartate aminotransferase family protein [Alphaproteobacteria bacterium]
MTATTDLLAKGRKFYVPNYKPRELIIDRGKGAHIWDLDGNEYIDFGAGIAVASLGYNDEDLIRALEAQAHKIWHTSNIFFTAPPIELAEALVEASRFATRVFFCNSGGEANEAAIKLARKCAAERGKPPEQRQIITFTGSFHGRTLTTVTATAQPKYQQGFEPLPQGFAYAPFNDFDAIEKMMGDHVCAVMVETIQGEGGVMPMRPGFLAHLRALTERHGALLMVDDVQAGMGRTGKLFSHWWEPGVTPDVVTLAKGLGGGMPIGAMLAGANCADVLQFGSHGSTFGGNPLATSVAHVVLKKLQTPALTENVEARSAQLIAGLEELGGKFGLFKEIRGRGLMLGAELTEAWHGKAGEIGDAARRCGVLVLQAGPNVLRFLPPLVITEPDVAQGLEYLSRALEKLPAA